MAVQVRSQKAWPAFRDEETNTICELIASKQGTMWHVVALGDRLELVKDRALQLQDYLDDVGL